MQTAFSTDYSLLNQRSQSVPGWLKFIGTCLLGLCFLLFALVSSQVVKPTLPSYISIYDNNVTAVLGMMWLYFLVYAVSFYGLINGRYWGLLACMALGYLSLAGACFTLVTEGKIDLMLVIMPVLLYQLHKIKAQWALLTQ